MATNRESSFGARLKNANDLVSYIRGFQNYNPPRTEESVDALASLTLTAEQLNTEAARCKSAYRTEVNKRQLFFRDGNASLERLLSPISKSVAAYFGKHSDESRQVTSIIREMRTTSLVAPPPAEGGNGETEEKNSRSQRSFGSVSKLFKDLVATLGKLNGYVPSNSVLSSENLTTLSESINASNTSVANTFQQLHDVRRKRLETYADLAERTSRVKLYVAAQYGNASDEFKLISKIKV
jgi:hypothetical protein